ncbi:MAG TPA: RsmB/NOP family class I SAM-dependent RNA methyltransferase [Burkholderiales bacterium]|nr:RsmB/NOP family class I SAM-dependent RNA methyltransferase [Burkholderiales bacterium]
MNRKLVEAAVEALRLVMRFDQPADAILSSYFRQQRALGQHDRAFVAEAVFGVLRHARTLEHVAGSTDPRRLLLVWLARFGGSSARDLAPILKAGESEWLGEVGGVAIDDLPAPVRAELPDWAYDRLIRQLGERGVLDLGRGLQNPAPLDLRVNTVRATRDAVLASLRESGLAAQPTRYSPVGVRLSGKPAINRHPLFLEGAVEVQDEGSQLIGYLLAPRRHELVVDFCAGAGGKSLMIGAMMNSQGRVYAFDVSAARLARLKPRLKRSGLSNLHPQAISGERDTKVKRLAGKIDRVLVDAPCSGLGTLRRNPDLKWRQSPASVAEMQVKQAGILEAAASLVKPGGRLVYATCSLLPEENETIVDAFLAQHADYEELSAGEILRQHGIDIEVGSRMRLWPQVHGTDGFFGAVLQRRK